MALILALSIHTFYGSGFVRSVDLLVLPNINPDAAFGIQVAIEDSLTNYTSVTFQAALLYTSSKSNEKNKKNFILFIVLR
jgi:protein transport protein SEC24